ncbi:DNA repair protein RadA [Vineibacter terrae]|uniref:DNA repair protein RadA n=1 Tax=Vineibacter terrae TaxID=2586908 RepID=UPI002E32E960|nr:DNA repair protein RadA [Vineibacter terrae]HEX2885441.1 DNA repair protein RadA [Vineibacter terrae]
MARPQRMFVCQSCGAVYAKWAGKCEACGGWNCIVEESAGTAAAGAPPGRLGSGKGRRIEFAALSGTTEQPPRLVTSIAEFDRVCGSGLVPGSALLIGGDPGIGKSTLLLQVAAALARSGVGCAYISGEEALDQVRLRARRLGLEQTAVQLAAATSIRDIVATLEARDGPAVAVIDSIQTMWLDSVDSVPGTVTQVRASAQALIELAKRRGVTVLLVGHVTKEGAIAGPRVLEHMVDTVLYFEGERGHQFRILRAVKNRFGPTDEIGVFEMSDRGLTDVANPSALFLAERRGAVSGACVFAGVEGTRPLLVEIQALVAPSSFATPRHAVVGWDSGRLAMVIAVLEARCGVTVGPNDVYLNVAGGLRIAEPAADLAVAAALLSSLADTPVPSDMVVFGEIGLGGEVRAVSQREARLKEAAKLGFRTALAPSIVAGAGQPAPRPVGGINVDEVGHLSDLVARLRPPGRALGRTPDMDERRRPFSPAGRRPGPSD